MPPLCSGLARRPLTAVAPVRIRSGVPLHRARSADRALWHFRASGVVGSPRYAGKPPLPSVSSARGARVQRHTVMNLRPHPRVRFPPVRVGAVGDDGPMTTTGAGEVRLDAEACHRAVTSRDRRFDGVFYTAVRTTGIYCRPSCPARTPAPANVTFHPSAAAAQAAGYRACKRCLPDATPGSPEWDVAASAAGRAMRLVADGVVDREGVEGLARRVGYTPRHLSRILTAELGAGPLALARARRAQTARVLIETTDLTYADIAFAAGFASVRQFNDTVREVYASTPTQLRGRRGRAAGAATGNRDDAAGGAHAVRGHRPAGLPRLPPGAGRGGGRTGLVRPHPRPAARPRHGPARAGRRARRAPAPPSSPPRSGCRTCATSRRPSSGPAGSSTPTATRSPSRATSPTTR